MRMVRHALVLGCAGRLLDQRRQEREQATLDGFHQIVVDAEVAEEALGLGEARGLGHVHEHALEIGREQERVGASSVSHLITGFFAGGTNRVPGLRQS